MSGIFPTSQGIFFYCFSILSTIPIVVSNNLVLELKFLRPTIALLHCSLNRPSVSTRTPTIDGSNLLMCIVMMEFGAHHLAHPSKLSWRSSSSMCHPSTNPSTTQWLGDINCRIRTNNLCPNIYLFGGDVQPTTPTTSNDTHIDASFTPWGAILDKNDMVTTTIGFMHEFWTYWNLDPCNVIVGSYDRKGRH